MRARLPIRHVYCYTLTSLVPRPCGLGTRLHIDILQVIKTGQWEGMRMRLKEMGMRLQSNGKFRSEITEDIGTELGSGFRVCNYNSEFQSSLLLSKKPMDSELDCYSKWRFTGDVRTRWLACLEAHTTLAK